MRLHVIGNGCPDPLPHWYGSSFILETEDSFVMIDCGPCTTQKLVQMGLHPVQIDHLFFTHHHFDHNADFACFALTRWDLSPALKVLRVYGPAPTERFVEQLLGDGGAFHPDWQARIDHPTSQELHGRRGGELPRQPPEIEARNLSSGESVSFAGWTVTARSVKHVEPTLQSLAYRIETADGSIVFAGDCADCDGLRELAQGAVTIVAACAVRGREQNTTILRDVITGSVEAGEIAADAGARRLILSHASPAVAGDNWREGAVADAGSIFEGEVLFPEEGTTVEV